MLYRFYGWVLKTQLFKFSASRHQQHRGIGYYSRPRPRPRPRHQGSRPRQWKLRLEARHASRHQITDGNKYMVGAVALSFERMWNICVSVVKVQGCMIHRFHHPWLSTITITNRSSCSAERERTVRQAHWLYSVI